LEIDEKKLILVVDDDEEVLDTTSTFLEFFGYSVIRAKSGQEAILKFKKYHPGLVFLDVKMPKMDGYTTFFEIEKQFSDANVIFMTAHADYSKWTEAKSKHALDIIEKPYSVEQIRELTNKFYPLR
jgi:DNA-binding NtrC family response regulator